MFQMFCRTTPWFCELRQTLTHSSSWVQISPSPVSPAAADEAFVTLVTSDSSSQGAAVVARSLRRHGTTRRIVVMVTPNVSEQCRFSLHVDFDEVVSVDPDRGEDQHPSPSPWRRPEFGLAKIQCWTLTQFSKCVFLEADTLVLCNVDDLFQREELSAAPDPAWPDCFNSGVFVFRPSLQTHSRILQHARQHGGVGGGDQNLLNSFFSGWSEEDIQKRLPFLYNLISSSVYSYLPAFHQFGHQAKIVHFSGSVKPWSRRKEDRSTDGMERFYDLWWKEHLSQSVGKQSGRRAEKTQISEHRGEVPVRDRLDICSSLLPHFTTPPQNQDPEPQPVRQSLWSTEMKTPPTESSQVLEEAGCSERPEDPPPIEEAARDGSAPPGGGDVLLTWSSSQQGAAEGQELQHRRRWEAGEADYLGRDAFQNIQKMLDRFLD
ncbi:glycogenin-2 isoform X1 [Oryzias melastigma]|uniref:glycogenin-2 isoform X1 n=1 Tax=Oryzias melastigma TaxID=30732 RepID=UPI00168D90F0|nr:glycogenin-2 isoform X1 [Oryzias melastigma]